MTTAPPHQALNVNMTVQVPDHLIMITKVQFEALKEQSIIGTYWNMKDLEQRINRKHEWIKDNILYPQRFRKILDAENGGFVAYPQSKGQTWSFQATRMAEFLDKHFQDIFSSN